MTWLSLHIVLDTQLTTTAREKDAVQPKPDMLPREMGNSPSSEAGNKQSPERNDGGRPTQDGGVQVHGTPIRLLQRS